MKELRVVSVETHQWLLKEATSALGNVSLQSMGGLGGGQRHARWFRWFTIYLGGGGVWVVVGEVFQEIGFCFGFS